jgi:hypothetical protein
MKQGPEDSKDRCLGHTAIEMQVMDRKPHVLLFQSVEDIDRTMQHRDHGGERLGLIAARKIVKRRDFGVGRRIVFLCLSYRAIVSVSHRELLPTAH